MLLLLLLFSFLFLFFLLLLYPSFYVASVTTNQWVLSIGISSHQIS